MATILIADDDPAIRAVYAALLKASGHTPIEARDGAEAIDLARERRPDLLLLDVWMPALNGFEVLEAARHDSTLSRMRVIMLSNLDDADTRLEAFSLGACDYLVKGIALDALRGRVDSALVDTLLMSEPIDADAPSPLGRP